jgi:hypothetical protein
VIGKQIKGRSFSKLLKYLFGKDGAILIGSNMEGLTPCELAAEFRFSQQLNPRVSRVVYHASLSLPHGEYLEDDTWHEIAQKYLRAMGFDMSQYAVVRHTDRDHDHAHIVASRVRLDGTTVSDSWDYRRSEATIRQLEQEYGLRSLHSSQTKDSRSPATGEQRLLARTGEESIRVQLQRSLDQVTQTPLTMPQLIKQLQQKGISVRISYCSTGEAKGISYEFNGVAFSGTHLGKAYTLTGLQKYRRVEYIKERDGCCMQKLVEYPFKEMTKEHTEESSLSKVYTKKAERKKRSVQELEL